LAAVKTFIVGSHGLIGWLVAAILIAFGSIDCAADAFLPLLEASRAHSFDRCVRFSAPAAWALRFERRRIVANHRADRLPSAFGEQIDRPPLLRFGLFLSAFAGCAVPLKASEPSAIPLRRFFDFRHPPKIFAPLRFLSPRVSDQCDEFIGNAARASHS